MVEGACCLVVFRHLEQQALAVGVARPVGNRCQQSAGNAVTAKGRSNAQRENLCIRSDRHGDHEAGRLMVEEGQHAENAGHREEFGQRAFTPGIVETACVQGGRDRKIDLLAVNSAGKLLLYRGNGAGGWLSGSGTAIGSGWGGFTSILYAGDFDGDKRADIVARDANGTLWLYGTTGTGGWLARKAIGSGWQGFDAVFSPGNFDGAGGPDLIARRPNGQLVLYKGDGRGGWSGSAAIGQGWNIFTQIG